MSTPGDEFAKTPEKPRFLGLFSSAGPAMGQIIPFLQGLKICDQKMSKLFHTQESRRWNTGVAEMPTTLSTIIVDR